ncbi:hypothetical protein DFH07DRAFT_818963 [Mycena maculata]|uniref:SET domain-containing protein n=1 Tax=Mycena maculata TaxID=230809 RepID=A0AAD7J6G2_9AGAR|nr:hypothetical protein DFH07DRAFT_818963 [Mycena maculata]
MDPQEDEDDPIANVTSIVQAVFQKVHDEFRVWKEDYASKILSSLARPPSPNATPTRAAKPNPPVPLPPDADALPFSTSTTLESIQSYDYESGIMEHIPAQVIRFEDLFLPLPAHEYCTPTNRNIFQGDDPSELPFIPFADDPTFDHAEYLKEYHKFSWHSAIDPDLELIVIETARRLHTEHHIRYRHIDETDVLPLELLDRNGKRGVLYSSRRRDFPDWPEDVPDSAKRLQDDIPAIGDTPDKKLAMLVSNFCTNLNCAVGFCSTHLDPLPIPIAVPPLVRNERMESLVQTPCGRDCFSLLEASEPVWPTDDLQLLRTILDLAPDTSPCDLAVICAKPCNETFHQRTLILPDVAPERKKPKGKLTNKPKQTKTGSHKFKDLDSLSFTPGKPCAHDGPCDATAQPPCACVLNKAHCERSCRCSRKCARRWRGCACSQSKTGRYVICRTDRCACWLAHRECDPEICLKCQAKYADADVCQNVRIQREVWKRTKVAPSTFGMGLFLAEAAAAGELIIEYIGELIFDPTTDSREPIGAHRGRCYLFELNDTLSVDGTYAANDARYINHSAHTPNCRAMVWMVNGEHRIGIFATRKIACGDEVLFNYGDNFFQERNARKSA